MRRAVRVFFHLAAGVSGVLFLLAVALWIASYHSMYAVQVGNVTSLRMLAASRGELGFLSQTFEFGYPYGSSAVKWTWKTGPAQDLVGQVGKNRPNGSAPIAGFMFRRIAVPDVTGSILLFPLAVLVAVFAPLPLADVLLIRRRRRRRRRLAAGLCVACGYDLRASPGRCPECGATPAATHSV
jgi:hypothetical protein